MTTRINHGSRFAQVSVVVLLLVACAQAAEPGKAEHGVLVRVATIYLSPDNTSSKMADVERGREVAILEKSNKWIHVLATLLGQRTTRAMTEESENPDERDITGWILDKGVVRASTPNGDQILYGAAADAEAEASRAHGRKGAAQDAFYLYSRTQEYFPNSPLAGEALYRAADIRWQLDREDVMSRPSARTKEAFLRSGMNEELMKQVMKKYPHTKWADLAAFHLIENKLCGDWQGSADCPRKEAEKYEKYAREYPNSTAAPEALYDAAWRLAALIDIYKTEEQPKKADEAKADGMRIAQEIVSKYPQSDWGARAQTLLYMMQQNIPTYGNATD